MVFKIVNDNAESLLTSHSIGNDFIKPLDLCYPGKASMTTAGIPTIDFN